MTWRALIVDDDHSMVRTLGDILRLKGWTVRTAVGSVEAVKLAVTEPFDVVLMDVRMPDMDGVAALQAMKSIRKNLPVVLMTAYAAEDRLEEAERLGALRILSKPVDIGALFHLLSSTIQLPRPLLIVDHDATFLRTLSEVLRIQGYETVVAGTLDLARRVMARQPLRAVLLHLHLGIVPARDAVATVHSANPGTALIVYSGLPNAEDEIDDAVRRSWIHAYLQKPFGVEEMTGVLSAIPGD